MTLEPKKCLACQRSPLAKGECYDCKILNRPLPTVEVRRPANHDGVPMCSQLVCPKYDSKEKRCKEAGHAFEVEAAGYVCIPEVRAQGQLKAQYDYAIEQYAKLDGLLRGLVRKHCLTPLMIGHSAAVDAAQKAEHDADPEKLRLRRDVATVDELHDALDTRLKTLKAANEYLRTQVVATLTERVRVAEAIRDDAKAASQRDLDAKREVERKLELANKPWTVVREPVANPFTGQHDGSVTETLFDPDGNCVGGGVAIPYKRKEGEG